MANIHIYDVDDDDLELALDFGMDFAEEYPDRVGIRQCVAQRGHCNLIAYRTTAGRIVVRGTAHEARGLG